MKDYGKGSRRRPVIADEEKFNSEWDRIFGINKLVDTYNEEPIDQQGEEEENPYGKAD